jgi:hypothetical protein
MSVLSFKLYEVGATSNGIMLIPSYEKNSKLVQRKQRQKSDPISLLLPLKRKETKTE